jgi:hypothetical protein
MSELKAWHVGRGGDFPIAADDFKATLIAFFESGDADGLRETVGFEDGEMKWVYASFELYQSNEAPGTTLEPIYGAYRLFIVVDAEATTELF